jgi:hypothetical protein
LHQNRIRFNAGLGQAVEGAGPTSRFAQRRKRGVNSALKIKYRDQNNGHYQKNTAHLVSPMQRFRGGKVFGQASEMYFAMGAAFGTRCDRLLAPHARHFTGAAAVHDCV